MNNLTNLIRPDLRDYIPYSSARDEAKTGKIWLNANESPFPFDEDDGLKINRYPDKQPIKLRQQIAELYGVDDDQIVLSRGSDEVIDLLVRLFCRAGQDSVMICTPTYGMYSVSARLQGAEVLTVPLIKANGYQLDLNNILEKWNPSVKIMFLCSPNNPTGNLLSKEDILFLCKEFMGKSIIVVDEAYIDYANADSLSVYIKKYSNLVILRTLSKAYGLAGARFGVLIGEFELVKWILKIIAPYPLSSQVVGFISKTLSANRKREIQRQIQLINNEKKRLMNVLQDLPNVVTVIPSDANFILVEVTNAETVMSECGKSGIVLRSMFDKPGLDNCIRISIGLPEENTKLIELLQQVARI